MVDENGRSHKCDTGRHSCSTQTSALTGVTGGLLQIALLLHPPKEIIKDLQSTGVAQEM